jgi:hypothetical protein
MTVNSPPPAERAEGTDQDQISPPEASPQEVLDFSSDIAKSSPAAKSVKIGDEYDPRPHEDGARRTIAFLLLGLLWLVISAILLMLAYGSIKIDELERFGVLLGPIVALVSAATGFYYGTKASK